MRELRVNEMKKYFTTALCLIFVSIGLTGCGSTQEPTAAAAPPAVTDEAVANEEVEQPTEVEAVVSEENSLEPTVTPPQEEPAPVQNWKTEIKGKGFTYDAENLTYELVWSDEFDYEGAPDSAKWGYDVGGDGWGNNERQYYTAGDNVTVDGEKLIIEARKEQMGKNEYTSTRLITKNKGDWLYGKIEVSAKLPSGLGTWPAIWMLPTDWEYGGWPDSGEIDIMEHVGYDMNRVHATAHTKAYHHSIGTQKGSSMVIEDVDTTFHTYSIEWLPDKIRFFIDGEETFVFDATKLITEPTYRNWPFDKRFHLLINIALGGNWGGAQGFDEDLCPVTMEVDYVRVYQAKELDGITNKK